MSIIETRGVAAAAQYLVERGVPIPVIARLLEERRLGLGARMRGSADDKPLPPEAVPPPVADSPAEVDKNR